MRRRGWLAGAIGVAALALLAPSVAAGAGHAPASGATKPSYAQLRAALTAAAAATKIPDLATTIPPVASLTPEADGAPVGINSRCYTQTESSVPANAATLCAWADTTSSHTLYVIGDSQASMWLNTLIPIAETLHWKIVEVAHTGCPPWPGQSDYEETGVNDTQCVQWEASELAFEQRLKPAAVLAIGDGYHAGVGKWATESQLVHAETTFVKDVAPAKVILLSPIPMYLTDHLGYTPSECLVAASSLKQCDFPPSKLVEPHQFDAAKAVAAATHETFIDVTPMFCTTKACPLVVDDHGERLVYLDGAHANRFYMDFISTAFEPAVKRGL